MHIPWYMKSRVLRWLIRTKHFPESKTLPRIQKHIQESKTLPRIQNTSQNPKHFPEFKNTFQNPKHFPESKNTSQNPKHFPELKNTFQNPKHFPEFKNTIQNPDSGRCFGIWEVKCFVLMSHRRVRSPVTPHPSFNLSPFCVAQLTSFKYP